MTETEQYLPFALPDIGDAEISAATEAMRSGWLTTGPRARALEEEFAAYLGGQVQTVALNSATAGLHLALEAAGVAPGDEVLVPTWTFTATAEVVSYLGAYPVLVDVDPKTLCLDLVAAEAAVTRRTRAVMPVHFAGLALDRLALTDFARRHNLVVVEDAAHSLPATSHGRLVGTGQSSATVFSFYATKTMTTGEGGMVATRDAEIAARIRTMRLHGINRDVFDRYRSNAPTWYYEVVAAGYKYNLPDPAAAIGRVQLSRLEAMRDRREAIARRYSKALAGLPLELPATGRCGDVHAWHLYVVRLDAGARVSRDAFIAEMSHRGVGCSVHFIPLHRQPHWRDAYRLRDEDFPVASTEFERVVSLPIFSAMSDEQAERVAAAAVDVLA